MLSDTCEQIVKLALETPENHRPYVVFTQCQKNPPDFLVNTSTRTCMEFARLFSLALHYNRKLVPADFCTTTLAYQDSQFTVDPLIEDHEHCVKTVGGVFEARAVRGALRTACNEAKSSAVLDCDRYVTELAESVADGVLDSGRLCDRVLTGKETTAFDPAHFLYTCVQYARHGDPVEEISRKCKTVANEEFCGGYVNVISKGATQSEIKAYCLQQEATLHSPIVAAPLEPSTIAGTTEDTLNSAGQALAQAQTPPPSVLVPRAPTSLTPAGSGVPHVKLSANMFTMCENTIDKVASPNFPLIESTVTDECTRQLGQTLLPEEMRILGDRVLSGCNYFASKFLQARTRPDFSRQAFCHALTRDSGSHVPVSAATGSPIPTGEQPPVQAVGVAPIVVAGEGDVHAVVQQTSGPLVQTPFGDGNSHAVGKFPREVQSIMVDTAGATGGPSANNGIAFSQLQQRAGYTSPVLEAARPILRHSFVDTTVQKGEDALMNRFFDLYEVEQATKKRDVVKKAENSYKAAKFDYSSVDATIDEFLKSYKRK